MTDPKIGVAILLALIAIVWYCLIATRHGIGEPIARAGIVLIALAAALELAANQFGECFRVTRHDVRMQFRPSNAEYHKLFKSYDSTK